MEQENIYQEFLNRFPIERLRNMSIEDYALGTSNTKSFCYWLEFETIPLGSIKGGSAYKHGIFKYNQENTTNLQTGQKKDDEYAWYIKYGNDRTEVFEKVRNTIVEIAQCAEKGDFGKIENIDFSSSTKLKIAFLYSKKRLLNIFKPEAIDYIASLNNIASDASTIEKLRLLAEPLNKDNSFWESTHAMWEQWQKSIHKYFIAKVTEETYFNEAVKGNMWMTQQRYEHQDKGTVTSLLNIIAKVNVGDTLFLANGDQIYAYGIAKECSFDSEQVSSIKTIRENRSFEFNSGIVTYEDSDVFYEDLTNGTKSWGQRIQVESWIAYNKNTECSTLKIKHHVKSGVVQMSLYEIDEKYANEKIIELNNQYNSENKVMIDIINLLKEKHNIILHGAPGTGKTYMARKIAEYMTKTSCKKTIEGFQKYLEIPGVVMTFDTDGNASRKRYLSIANKLVEEYGTLDTIYNQKDEISKQLAKEHEGKSGWDTRSMVLKHICKYMESENNISSNSNIGFVQFHPSYDYTDFVEGLRPTPPDANGNVGFQRTDGIFKAFCKKAAENLQRSNQTTIKQQEKNLIIKDIIEDFLVDAEINSTKFSIKQNEYYIEDHNDTMIYVKIPSNERANKLSIRIDELSQLLASDVQLQTGKDITNFFNRKYRLQHDSYILSLYQELKPKVESASQVEVRLEEKRNYVFVIDEINRGDMSKILGELFFSIDPGYRYKIDKTDNIIVTTQYQNMILDANDEFKNGFYIPDNVYIIGTMNDIDRSVESMDFAMRRRFVFNEITAEMSAEQMGIKYENSYLADLNQAIVKEAQLSKDYQIGASYVLGNKDCINKDGDNAEHKAARQKLWNNSIGCLLKEYLRGTGREDKIDNLAKSFGVE